MFKPEARMSLHFINFMDDYSRYEYVYIMRHKSVAFEEF